MYYIHRKTQQHNLLNQTNGKSSIFSEAQKTKNKQNDKMKEHRETLKMGSRMNQKETMTKRKRRHKTGV